MWWIGEIRLPLLLDALVEIVSFNIDHLLISPDVSEIVADQRRWVARKALGDVELARPEFRARGPAKGMGFLRA